MKPFLLFFTFIIFFNQNSFSIKVDGSSELKTEIPYQDKTYLIKKTKAKMKALAGRRKRLKVLKKWSDAKEKNYQNKTQKLKNNLLKLGNKSIKHLNTDEIIKKLQKELKYLNNSRVNKNAFKKFTKKDDSIYKIKAAVLIDSIIKLRVKKG